ncbi:MAG: glycosyltransferase [Isosphaeraceae bacterium]
MSLSHEPGNLAQPPEISVAIPTMNGGRHIAATIRSILDQSLPPRHLMIFDDRSDDDTLDQIREIAGDFAQIEVNRERLGLARNWNRCVERCPSDLIAIVHQDDVLFPEHLQSHAEAHARSPEAGLVASNATVIDTEGASVPATVVEPGGLGPFDRTFAPGEALPLLATGNPFRCSAVTLRVSAHQALGGFDPAFRYVVDWEFWLRIAETWGIAWLAQPTVAVRWHLGSETHRFKQGVLDLEETRVLLARNSERLKARGQLDLAAERSAQRRLARAYLNRAYDGSRGRDGSLTRQCLRKAIQLDPALLATLVHDPRLALRLGLAALTPRFVSSRIGRMA